MGKGQAQDSLTDQIKRVIRLAEQAGEYDAADWIKGQLRSKYALQRRRDG